MFDLLLASSDFLVFLIQGSMILGLWIGSAIVIEALVISRNTIGEKRKRE